MKTILNNFQRWINSGNGLAMCRQMSALERAAMTGKLSTSELNQIKLALLIMTKGDKNV